MAASALIKMAGMEGKQLLTADDFGDTPLHVAARHNQKTSISNLVVLGRKEAVNLALKNMDGETALDVAKRLEHEECASVLRMVLE